MIGGVKIVCMAGPLPHATSGSNKAPHSLSCQRSPPAPDPAQFSIHLAPVVEIECSVWIVIRPCYKAFFNRYIKSRSSWSRAYFLFAPRQTDLSRAIRADDIVTPAGYQRFRHVAGHFANTGWQFGSATDDAAMSFPRRLRGHPIFSAGGKYSPRKCQCIAFRRNNCAATSHN